MSELVSIGNAHPLFLEEVPQSAILFEKEDYEFRINLLLERMKERECTHVIIYGDREHFSNMEYFTGYDCRWEEALFILDQTGHSSILVGNEGLSQTLSIPYEIQIYLYQNFSLPGQPRDQQEHLGTILEKCGLNHASRPGVVGWKYFEPEHIEMDPIQAFDLPWYMMETLFQVCDRDKVVSFTKEIIGFPGGIRMRLYNAKEIAWAENAGNRTASVMQRMLKSLRPGISEIEVGMAGHATLEPTTMHPNINFGEEKIRIGVGSPSFRRLELGEVCGLCYATRGNLTSKVGIAAYNEETISPTLKPWLWLYSDFWYAVTRWLEKVKVGACCGELYDTVMELLGDEKYHVTLNPTHYGGTEEWSNSPMMKGASYCIEDAALIQVDIIAGNDNPAMTAICEDCVVIAGKELREQLRAEYPSVYERIIRRQSIVRKVLGIQISDDVLPMSNLNFVYYPYMLNLNQVYTLNCGSEKMFSLQRRTL